MATAIMLEFYMMPILSVSSPSIENRLSNADILNTSLSTAHQKDAQEDI
jgi:hypothetical protein